MGPAPWCRNKATIRPQAQASVCILDRYINVYIRRNIVTHWRDETKLIERKDTLTLGTQGGKHISDQGHDDLKGGTWTAKGFFQRCRHTTFAQRKWWVNWSHPAKGQRRKSKTQRTNGVNIFAANGKWSWSFTNDWFPDSIVDSQPTSKPASSLITI